MARLDLPKSQLREKRRRQRVLMGVLSALGVVVCIGATIGLSWLPFVRIQSIEVSGTNTLSIEALRDIAAQEIKGAYAFVYAKSNIFLYPKGKITNALTSSFPTLGDVSVRAKNFQTIEIAVTERTPVALWCGETHASSSQCFLMDESGLVYAPAVVFSGDVYKQYFGALATTSLPRQYLTREQFKSVSAFVEELQTKQALPINTIVVDGVGDVQATNPSGFSLFFSLEDDAGDVLERFVLAKAAEPFVNRSFSEFEYLDLRFGDKLYYKLR